jgi:hypothetical protein
MIKKPLMSRRAFTLKGATLGLAALTPQIILGIPTRTRQTVIRTPTRASPAVCGSAAGALLGRFQNSGGTGH